ncbi:hypothetical protein B9Q03_13315 [Candidatus Marsarchaeota G2 archaeon OSP_D]|uniref:Uncharacterized protein n=1 Tax=Candidatus Marsarchaeota G2 archaeon OSP_D TaxID=1978157 RepID=A0A2R6ABH5_9ARCH|nr:MAG: hypothetical protein B9Q03_13315 [Candidatus Marsarchaeota G2 archaeon OSP_D]
MRFLAFFFIFDMPKHMSYEVNGVKFLLTEKEAKSYLFCLKCKQYEPFFNFLENLTNALKAAGGGTTIPELIETLENMQKKHEFGLEKEKDRLAFLLKNLAKRGCFLVGRDRETQRSLFFLPKSSSTPQSSKTP